MAQRKIAVVVNNFVGTSLGRPKVELPRPQPMTPGRNIYASVFINAKTSNSKIEPHSVDDIASINAHDWPQLRLFRFVKHTSKPARLQSPARIHN